MEIYECHITCDKPKTVSKMFNIPLKEIQKMVKK